MFYKFIFKRALFKTLSRNYDNWYGEDNMDPDRPELYTTEKDKTKCFKIGAADSNLSRQSKVVNMSIGQKHLKKKRISKLVRKRLSKRKPVSFSKLSSKKSSKKTIKDLSLIYHSLCDSYSKSIFLNIIAFKILGFRKVKLPLNSKSYWDKRNYISKMEQSEHFIASNFRGLNLFLFDLSPLNFSIKMYSLVGGILVIFALQQYRYNNDNTTIEAEDGDYVIDAGGCWGDTALYFSEKVGANGKVYTFEFIPSNIDIMSQSFDLNPTLKKQIDIIQNPLWSDSDIPCSYIDRGPPSRILIGKEYDDRSETIKTISIDDAVLRKNIPKVDFIKMDIEGAELFALKGALKTIQKFRPKLAISVYHNGWNDFINIPGFLKSLNLGYRFYFDHFTIHNEESVLFAKPANKT
jgi:FkbM family methyltransferase